MGESASPASVFERRFVVHDVRDEIEAVEARIVEAIEKMGYDGASAFAIRLALEEAMVNAFRHGNRGDPQKTVSVDCRIDPATVRIEVEDQGEGFDPTAVPDPTELDNIEIPSGRGLMLMRAYMSEVSFSPKGNRVRMVFQRRA
jgi:serine/threonine-protein kinase RsbW